MSVIQRKIIREPIWQENLKKWKEAVLINRFGVRSVRSPNSPIVSGIWMLKTKWQPSIWTSNYLVFCFWMVPRLYTIHQNVWYSGDLNSGNIWIGNFHLFAIQMPANSSLFKPSVTQPISQTTYDLNSKLLVRYSSHDLNNEPFKEQTVLDHLNTEQVCYSDPHCFWISGYWDPYCTGHIFIIIQIPH